MLRRRRLAKEDYALMGGNHVWLLRDAVMLLTSFEMEVSDVFGETDELVEFMAFYVSEPDSKVWSIYDELSTKWFTVLQRALLDGEIPYANIPKRDEPQWELPEGAGKTITDTGSFHRDELLRFLVSSVESGKLELDLKAMQDFLNGKGSAPTRAAASAPSRPQPKEVKKDKKKSERGKAGAAKRWSEVQETKEVIKKYAAEMDEQGCTCNHSQLGVEIHESAIDSSGKALLGRSEISLDVVKETVKDLFKHRGIKRVRGVDVFKDETACKIHHPEEFKAQQRNKSS